MRVSKEYCCDASRLAYQKYYMGQVGSGMPGIFIGARNQKGHGIGSVLSGLFRSAAPILKKGLASLGKSALSTGLNIATDVLEGKNAGDAARQRVSQGIKNLAQNTGIVSRQVEEEEEEVFPKKQLKKKRRGLKRRQTGRGGIIKRRRPDIFD